MTDSSGPAGGGSVFDYIKPVQETQEPTPDLKVLALNMLRQAILDIPNQKWRSRTLRWVNDCHPATNGWVTSFETVCQLLDRDANRTRRLLNRFAASGLTMEQIRNGCGRPEPVKKPGSRKSTSKRKRRRQ